MAIPGKKRLTVWVDPKLVEMLEEVSNGFPEVISYHAERALECLLGRANMPKRTTPPSDNA